MPETVRLYKYNVPLLQLGYYFLTNVSQIVARQGVPAGRMNVTP